jgi:hypothetical protein
MSLERMELAAGIICHLPGNRRVYQSESYLIINFSLSRSRVVVGLNNVLCEEAAEVYRIPLTSSNHFVPTIKMRG